ncbi:MAG: hypothetical protein H6836_08370 [Planctomycetes bacterium]|nr:hypothetical protein [Planctomycetota bacterium]
MQQAALGRQIRGHCAYYGLTGNARSLAVFRYAVLQIWRKWLLLPRLRGRAFFVRYADDFVIAFERQDDALRVHDVLPKRFAGYGLELHPDQTKLLDFRRPRYGGGDDAGSFDLLRRA